MGERILGQRRLGLGGSRRSDFGGVGTAAGDRIEAETEETAAMPVEAAASGSHRRGASGGRARGAVLGGGRETGSAAAAAAMMVDAEAERETGSAAIPVEAADVGEGEAAGGGGRARSAPCEPGGEWGRDLRDSEGDGGSCEISNRL